MSGGFPAISGNELIKVLTQKGGWKKGRHSTHGLTITKKVGERTLVTFIPTKNDSLPKGTLAAILRECRLTKEDIQKLLYSS